MIIREITLLLALTVLAALAASPPVDAQTAAGEESGLTNRIGGASRVETAVELSRSSYPEGTDAVVIARSDAYPDALAGGPLARALNAPLLLSSPTTLSPETAAEVRRLDPTEVILLGGPVALAEDVVGDLDALGVNVRRIGGPSRYDTAAEIAAALQDEVDALTGAYVVLGEDQGDQPGWADAVAVGPLAASQGRPILLATGGPQLPAATLQALANTNVAEVAIVGGSRAVRPSVDGALEFRGYRVRRVAGASRFETADAVAKVAAADGADPTRLSLATAGQYPDALAAGPAVAVDGGVLLLVDGSGLASNGHVLDWLDQHGGAIETVRLIGGPEALSEQLATEIAENLLAGRSTTDRIRIAHTQGGLGIDDAARYSVLAIVDPEKVPAEFEAVDSANDTRHSLAVAGWWNDIDAATREEILGYLEPRPAPEQSATDAFAGAGQDCNVSLVVGSFPVFCRVDQDVDGDGEFEYGVYYNVGRLGVPDTDINDNDRPDLIDSVIGSLNQAWTVYVDLGFTPPERVEVVMNPFMPPGAGFTPPFSGAMHLDTDPNFVGAYLPRHELFHSFQWQEISADDYGRHQDGFTWWTEATAEWAAGVVNAHPNTQRRVNGHANSLPSALGHPLRRYDRAENLSGGPEYGSFPVAQYLEERFGGTDVVRDTLVRAGAPAFGENPAEVVADVLGQDRGFAEEFVDYRLWTYTLAETRGVGFATPDVDDYWRPALQNDPLTAGATEQDARPHRVPAPLRPGIVGSWELMAPTAAQYVDLQTDASIAAARIQVETNSPDVRAVLLPFSDYPALCRDPIPLERDDDGLFLDVTLDPSCPELTLAIINAASLDVADSWVSWSVTARGPMTLGGEGLTATIRFGDGIDETLDAVGQILGSPTDDTGWIEGCSLDGEGANERYVSFGDLGLRLGRFDAESFRGYVYGGDDDQLLRTDRGIGPASTNADLRQAYPEAESTESKFGFLWSIPTTDGGTIIALPMDSEPATEIGALRAGAGNFCE